MDSLNGTNAKRSSLLNREEAANYLRLSPGTLANWITTHRVKLPYLKLGRRVFYREEDLTKWMDAQAVNVIGAEKTDNEHKAQT
jgi:excisionase family DNA binding protein